MSFRNLLLLTTGDDSEAHALEAALALADGLDAHLAVLSCAMMPEMTAAYGSPAGAAFIGEEMARARRAGEEAADRLGGRLERAGRRAEVRHAFGIGSGLSSDVGKHCRYADLVLLPRAGADDPGVRVMERAADGALFHGGRPLIQLPPGWSEAPGKRIVVAWDASLEAARATGAAMPLLEQADAVSIALADPDPDGDRHGEEPGAALGTALSRHNSNVTVDRLPGMGRRVSETLLDHARDWEADLVIHGAYSHSRLAESMFGGATHEFLRGAERPILTLR